MSTIDQQFVEYIAKSLVGNPDDVKVERTIDERGVLLKLTVNPEDLGRIIGKRGSTAIGIRTLLRALGTKNDARYNLKIIDPTGGYSPQRDDRAPESDYQSNDSTAVSDTESVAVAEETKVQPEVAEEAEPEEAVAEVETPDEELAPTDNQSSLADKTRKELAELDDLDI